jgi:hypothetical protein
LDTRNRLKDGELTVLEVCTEVGENFNTTRILKLVLKLQEEMLKDQ